MTPQEVIALFGEPETLMRHCFLMIAGGSAPAPPNGQAAVATFSVTVTDKEPMGFTTGASGFFGKKKKRAYVRITKLSGPAKAAPGPTEFNAYYVPMVQTSDVASGNSHYSLPTAGAPTLMITSKLSGCTFAVGSDGHGAKLVTHVQPNMSNKQVAQRTTNLSAAVGQGFQSENGRFAKRDEYAETATVIGRRTGANWKFFLQATDYVKGVDVISGVTVVE